MKALGAPEGVFKLNDSNNSVGSYLTKEDLIEIFDLPKAELSKIRFITRGTDEVVDERDFAKIWYKYNTEKKVSLDEIILTSIIKKAYPTAQIQRQVRIKRFLLDLKVTLDDGREVFVEFDGPSHFVVTRYGAPKYPPIRKKTIVEQTSGIEVVNWTYWIQRCEQNVRALFDKDVQGYGALWSSNIHFGQFVFDNSAEIIKGINNRFNIEREKSIGYIYEGETLGRNNPEHPIIDEINSGKKSVEIMLPKGFNEKDYWLPKRLR